MGVLGATLGPGKRDKTQWDGSRPRGRRDDELGHCQGHRVCEAGDRLRRRGTDDGGAYQVIVGTASNQQNLLINISVR